MKLNKMMNLRSQIWAWIAELSSATKLMFLTRTEDRLRINGDEDWTKTAAL